RLYEGGTVRNGSSNPEARCGARARLRSGGSFRAGRSRRDAWQSVAGEHPCVRRLRPGRSRGTRRFQDPNVALNEGYVPTFGCVSGSSEGAMGVHFVNMAKVGNPGLEIADPE